MYAALALYFMVFTVSVTVNKVVTGGPWEFFDWFRLFIAVVLTLSVLGKFREYRRLRNGAVKDE
ncbi:hypothetical protein GCM10027403_19550 [Arthrobacter tecti]